MINNQDQNNLLRLIAEYIGTDITAFAIGGTAMMFHGYKEATKDIDLIFQSEEDRKQFVHALKRIGYQQKAPLEVYDQKRLKEGKPMMFMRNDERFDLFVKTVFSIDMEQIMQKRMKGRFDFIGEHTLTLKTPSPEDLILLKAVTGREKDYDDILSICTIERTIDWEYVTDEALRQAKYRTRWIVLDLEETMRRLQKRIYIEQKYFKKLYEKLD